MSKDDLKDSVEEPVYVDEIDDVESDEETVNEDVDSSKLNEEIVKDKKDSTPIPVIVRKKQSVTQSFNIDLDDKLDTGDEIVLPSNFDKETRAVLEKAPNIDLLDDPDSRAWATDLAEGLELSSYNETYVHTLEDEEADFQQKLEHSGVGLSAQAPRFKTIENQTLKGERAVIRFVSHLGLGSLFQVPLWHSGLWVTFKPPSEAEIIELNRLINADKISFGRYSYGLSFSNTSSYLTNRLVDYALAHVYDLTCKAEDVTVSNLKDHISCQDIPILLWGFICTMYPRGFMYRRACINDAEKCNHVVSDTLNISKLQWTNINALTDWQKVFMSGRASKGKDLASINRYKEELSLIQNKRIIINKDQSNEIAITIKTPSIAEHVEAGFRWVSDITDNVERTLGSESNIDERNAFIIKHGQATAMRQYIHWIESIEYDSNIITDRETLEKTLDVVSADDYIRTEFTASVVKYIDKTTMSVIGIPVFDCPSCSKEQPGSKNLPEFSNIIPLDVMQLFFALLTQRIARLTDR